MPGMFNFLGISFYLPGKLDKKKKLWKIKIPS
jgi:hypothetical protein